MKHGFATATVLLLIGLIAIFTIAVYVGNNSGFFSNAQRTGDLGLNVSVQNVSGKAVVSASWKTMTGAEYRYAIYKGGQPIGEPVVKMKSTSSNSYTSPELTLENGNYTFFLMAGRGTNYPQNTNQIIDLSRPHVDQDSDGGFGANNGMNHGYGPNDAGVNYAGFIVDAKVFNWNSGTSSITPTPIPSQLPTLPSSADKLDCTGLGFYTVGSKQNGAYTFSAPTVLQAKPGDKLYVASSLINHMGQAASKISSVYRFSGNAGFQITDKDFCQVTSDKRVVCSPANMGANQIASSGVVEIKIAANAQIGSTLTVKENLTINGAKTKTQDCTQVTLSVVAQ